MIKFIHFPCWEVCDYTKQEQCFSNFTITSIRKSTPVMTVIISPSHPKRSDIIHFGTRFKSSWTGQLHWCSLSVRGYSHHFILTASTGTVKLKFLKCGCLRSDNTTAVGTKTDCWWAGCKESQFYSLPFGKAVASNCTSPQVISTSPQTLFD